MADTPKKKAGGRKSLLTEETTKEIMAGVAMGLSYKDAALFAGISESTFFKWKKKGEQQTRGKFFQFLQSLDKANVAAKAKHLGYQVCC